MSIRHSGLWHYEGPITTRSIGHEWRIGDEDDDMVTDCGTEAEAAHIVELHNNGVRINTLLHKDKREYRG